MDLVARKILLPTTPPPHVSVSQQNTFEKDTSQMGIFFFDGATL